MNAQMLLENFEFIANAPGGVKRLREMVFHYAISGNLVAQIDSEGTAEQDIEKASLLREEFEQRFKIRSRKLTESLGKEEIPFSIPTNWKWVRMERIACYIQRGKGPAYAVSGQALVVSQKCIQWSGFDLTPARKISDESLGKYGEERFLTKGDILWNSTGTGTAGRVAVYPGSQELAVTDSHVTIIRLTNFIPQYVWCYLASPIIQAKMAPNQEGSMVSGTTNQVELSTSKIAELLVPCPPLEEQKRIVAKVDELMALCDKLEAQQQERERRFPMLSRACHARFVESPTLANLKAIFDGAVSPDDLRNTILSLAEQGKITRQNEKEKNYSALEDVSEIIVDCPHSTPKWTESGKICVRTNQIQPGYLDLSQNRFVSNETYKERTKRLIPRKDDILYSREGGILGVACRVPADTELCLGQRMMLIRAGKNLLPAFLELVLNSPTITKLAREKTTGGAAPRVNMSTVRKYPIPIPSLDEQRRIVAKVDQLMALIDKLEQQQAKKSELAQAFAQAAVAAITGAEIKEPEKMKAPKTELVSRLQTKNTLNANDLAPLAKLITEHDGELSAKALWQRSGLEIDAFYQQLRTEMANGWIIEPEKAVMKEIEAD